MEGSAQWQFAIYRASHGGSAQACSRSVGVLILT